MSLKIKSPAKEETSMGTRNTSIVHFASFALIPLLLAFFIGWNIGKVKTTNDANLIQKLVEKNLEIDSLIRLKKQKENDLEEMYFLFSLADSLFKKYQSEDFATLEKRLSEATDEMAIFNWEEDQKKTMIKFNNALREIEDSKNFAGNVYLDFIKDYAIEWISDGASAKSKYLVAMKIVARQGRGESVTDDLSGTIKTLDDQITGYRNQITEFRTQAMLKEKEISDLKEKVASGTTLSQKDLLQEQEKISEAERKYMELKTKAAGIKEGILGDLDLTRLEILPELQPKRWLQKNNDQINEFKNRLEIKLNAIERHALELD